MSDDEEDFINYGSPLEVLNEDNIHSQKVPRLEDQIVTDKNGKRRFHGAFSGGFSAGYFNSVGSKDGWTPSTFVSSSSSKRTSQTFSSNDPRLYMDDEDLNDHGIAPQRIQATTSYDAQNQKKRKREDENVGPIPGQPVLEELLQPSRDTIGQKLLKKLGWRPGQGIGPRVSKKEKRLAEKESKKIWKASLSFAINDSPSDSEEDASEYSSFKFAPSDIEALCVNPKSNFFGLGYQPLNKTNPFGGKSSAYESNSRVSLEKSKGFFRGQAFGVGAFEEEDEDIYTKDNMQNYDFTLGCPEEFNQQKDKSTALGTCGIIAQLEGFKLSSKSPKEAQLFPLPVLPVGFKAWHQPRRRRFERKEEESRGLGRHELSIDDRKRIISDSTNATKVEIRSGVKGDNSCTQEKKNIERSPPSNLPDANEDQKNVSRKPDLQYFSSFKPFSANSEKQKRYDSYLKFKEKGLMEQFHCMQPKSMTDWEKNQERMEFQRAASIYRPLTSTMASRFTSGNFEESILDFNKSTKGATKPTDVLNLSEVDDRMKAAKTKMFGQLTQSVCEWRPVKTLCKRFNVPSLFSESSSVGVSSKKVNLLASCSFLPDSIAKISDFENSKEEEENVDAMQVDSLNESSTISSQTSMDEDRGKSTEILDSETYGLKVPVGGPPTMDLFKAIFQDSDSDSDENDKQLISNLEAEKYINKSQLKRPSRFDKPKESFDSELTNFLFNAKNENIPQTENITLAQAKGVFKNVDFYSINQYRNESTNKEENCSFANKDWTSEIEKKKYSDDDDSDNSESEEEYGPILPPNFIPQKSSASDCSKSSSVSVVINDNYLQNVSVKKEKKSKHKNKDKHKHKKSKKKKQKDKRDHRKSKHR